MLVKVISGGQTGADRAALDVALDYGFPSGGSCPVGRLAEDGVINQRYPLVEYGEGYPPRTRKNVLDADGTVIFYESDLNGGTKATLDFCIDRKTPYILIDSRALAVSQAARLIEQFIAESEIETLNIAGPRASKSPQIYSYVKQTLEQVIQIVKSFE
ncbi:putative molybdenum carrier protein [Thiomicrorhabdus heinhorstiae]|uniref:Molybdenum carrier protein n=1 Tax=Thiomicrorhabdus heinhorstiae TaxID=2748010 RepID=A0ABS0BTB9_9GAMM|nr:putative molybdenum carrier protein [Thiomicrorhabdus heinhorstiae]MBF6057088.1 putative molybdenum carrier protein [Thiomicrorhabdus heinhorstiae]